MWYSYIKERERNKNHSHLRGFRKILNLISFKSSIQKISEILKCSVCRKDVVNLTGKEASPMETTELIPHSLALSVEGRAVPRRLF